MKLDHIKHVFFDLDHTLWDFDRNSALTFEKIFILNGISINLDEFLEVYVPLNLAYWKMYREERIDKESLRFRRLDDAFKQLNFEVTTRMIYRLSEDYIKYLTTFNHLFEGTFELLDYLSPKYSLHIITNGFEEIQVKKLKGADIYGYFDQVVNSEMAGVKKPNLKIFELALDMAGTTSNRSIMIGDNIEADVLGAKAAGFTALHFNAHNDPPHDHCQMISDLGEIKSFL